MPGGRDESPPLPGSPPVSCGTVGCVGDLPVDNARRPACDKTRYAEMQTQQYETSQTTSNGYRPSPSRSGHETVANPGLNLARLRVKGGDGSPRGPQGVVWVKGPRAGGSTSEGRRAGLAGVLGGLCDCEGRNLATPRSEGHGGRVHVW